MRGVLAGGLLAAGAVALAAAGTAGAQGGDAATLVSLIETTQQQFGRLAAVQEADRSTNIVRGVGALVGLGVGIAIGSVATYARWRR